MGDNWKLQFLVAAFVWVAAPAPLWIMLFLLLAG